MLREVNKNSTEEAIEHSYKEPPIYFKTHKIASDVKQPKASFYYLALLASK